MKIKILHIPFLIFLSIAFTFNLKAQNNTEAVVELNYIEINDQLGRDMAYDEDLNLDYFADDQGRNILVFEDLESAKENLVLLLVNPPTTEVVYFLEKVYIITSDPKLSETLYVNLQTGECIIK